MASIWLDFAYIFLLLLGPAFLLLMAEIAAHQGNSRQTQGNRQQFVQLLLRALQILRTASHHSKGRYLD